MIKITGLSHLFKWENLHNWWLTKYFFAPLYIWPVYTRLYPLFCKHLLWPDGAEFCSEPWFVTVVG